MNKRKALIGWLVYSAAKPLVKRAVKDKAKSAAPAKKSSSRWRVTTAGIAGGLAAVGGAVFFWRRKSGGEEPSAES